MTCIITYFIFIVIIGIIVETIDFLDRRKAEKILGLKLNRDWSIK